MKNPLIESNDAALLGSALGKPGVYSGRYDAGQLYAIARAPQREAIGVAGSLPFSGADFWTAYELSWLNGRGKPQVAIARIMMPCESTHLIESKSLKLYLNGFSDTRFADAAGVQERIEADLSAALWPGQPVRMRAAVQLVAPEDFDHEKIGEMGGVNLDRLDIECTDEEPAPELLSAAFDEKPVEELLTSRLLKSNCPVTGQPDWGSVQIRYAGPQIEQGGLLRYIVGFRHQNGFHEQCVERIFMDLWRRCRPSQLTVHARYTRRGGIDINPYRTSHPGSMPAAVRTARQ